MVLDIKPIHNDGLNCIEDVIVSLAAYYNREYILAFAEAFRFEYVRPDIEQEVLIGSYINSGMKNMLYLINQYCGISIEIIEPKSVQKVIQVINEQLQVGLPTGIYIKSYWCPWHLEYQKLSHAHFCLAIGFDDGGNIICIDPSLGLDTYSLPYNDFVNGFGTCCTFSIGQPPKAISYELVLKNAVEVIPNTNIFTNMRRFIADFYTSMNFHEEYKNADICLFDVPMHRNLWYKSGERKLFSEFIKYIYKMTLNAGLLDVSDDLLYVRSKWSVADALLIKAHYAGYSEKVKENVCNVFKEILEIEENIYEKLNDIVHGNYITTLRKDCNNDYARDISKGYVFIDLKEYYNNIAFHSSCSLECSADFTGTGAYLLSHNAPSGQVISSNDMIFRFPVLSDGSPDNISCNGQKICLPVNTYKGIMFLGTAEWGSFIENVGIESTNGDRINIKINFSDWVVEKPLYDEKFIWTGMNYEKKQASSLPQKNCSIMAIYRTIENIKDLDSIILPCCPNIHIFAITLCK